MNPSNIYTVRRTVRNGRVLFLGAVFEVPPELQALLEGEVVVVDYHVHDDAGLRLRTQGDAITCWAPKIADAPPPQSTLGPTPAPVSPASAAAERQSHTDGPSAQAASGGHQTTAAALVEEYRSTEPLINAIVREQRVAELSGAAMPDEWFGKRGEA